MASLASISKELGLSKATVSRAFDPRFSAMVKPETRKRIFDFCKEKNYHPTMIGRSFSTGRTFKIAVVRQMASWKNFPLSFAAFFSGIHTAAQEHNYTPILLSPSDVDLVRASVADAYIIDSFNKDGEIFDFIVQNNFNAIAFDLYNIIPDGLPVLHRDITPAYRRLWQNLKPEYQNQTAFIGRGKMSGKWHDLQSAAPPGVSVDFLLISLEQQHFLCHRDSARSFAEKNLEQLKKYKLLWCSSDLVALGIADTLKSHGIIPGKDIYIVGFDNLERYLEAFPESGLTTIDPCWYQSGQIMVKMLLAELDSGEKLPPQSLWLPEAVFRNSFPERN